MASQEPQTSYCHWLVVGRPRNVYWHRSVKPTSQLLAITTATPPINHVYHCRRLPDDVAVDSLVLNEDVHGRCHMDHQSDHSVCKHTDISSPSAPESNLEENFPPVICSLAEPNGCLALILIMRIPSLPPLSMARTPYKSHYQLTVGRTWQFHSHLLMGRTLSSLCILSSQRWAVLGCSSRSTLWGESHGSPWIFRFQWWPERNGSFSHNTVTRT